MIDSVMARLFTAHDVASLTAAFPPPKPTTAQPSLVRHGSGDTFTHSAKTLEGFDALLNASSTRVAAKNLAAALDIDNADWILPLRGAEVVLSRDGRDIIPRQEVATILEKISDEAAASFVDLNRMMSVHDLAQESLQSLAEREIQAGRWLSYPFDGQRLDWITTPRYASHFKDELWSRISAAGNASQVHFHKQFPQIPTPILARFAAEVVESDRENGQLECDDDKVIFTPSGFGDSLIAANATKRKNKIDATSRQYREQGYCLVDDAEIMADVSNGLDGPLTHLGSLPKDNVVLIKDSFLETMLQSAREKISVNANNLWNSRTATSTNEDLHTTLLNRVVEEVTDSDTLRAALLRHEPDKLLTAAVATELAQLQSQDNEAFKNRIHQDLLAPLNLYKYGIDVVKDGTLRDHLEQFCGDHARRELVPMVLQRLGQDRLLLDKNRSRNVDKFEQAMKETKTLSELHAALQKFMKKLKIEAASADTVQRSKSRLLEQTVSSMQSMSRGSDLLQNLLWILLASRTTGVYLSSGKDTSRMIKFYGSVGSPEILTKLEGWKDALKAGQDSAEAQRGMLEMAVATLRELTTSHEHAVGQSRQ